MHRLDYQHNHWCGPGSGYLRPLANDEYHNRNIRFSVVVYLAQDLWHRKMQLRQQIQATEIWKCHLINVSTENHVSDSFTHCLICFEFYQSFFIKGNIKIADISRMWAYKKKKIQLWSCMYAEDFGFDGNGWWLTWDWHIEAETKWTKFHRHL